MKKQELEAFAREVAKGHKTEQDLNEFSQMLTKVTVEAALVATGAIVTSVRFISWCWKMPRSASLAAC